MGLYGGEWRKMHQLAQCLTYYEAYHHVVGDLNAEPQDWPPNLNKEMRTQIVVPQGTAWTCNQGQMRNQGQMSTRRKRILKCFWAHFELLFGELFGAFSLFF